MTTATTHGNANDGYAFSNSALQAPQQLDALTGYLDPHTIPFIDDTDILVGASATPGAQRLAYLELGPGDGTILRWLFRATGSAATYTAVDLDPSQLEPVPGLTIFNHDLTTGLPPGLRGPFDLIHARLVLVHTPNRDELVDQLVAMLAPGGWLVLGEFSDQPLIVKAAPTSADATLFTTVIDAFLQLLISKHNVDITWAHRIHSRMIHAGLEEIHTIEHAESWTGGQPECDLHLANIAQKRPDLLALGLTTDQLDRFEALMRDPRFSARSWQFVCTRGRKPGPRRT